MKTLATVRFLVALGLVACLPWACARKPAEATDQLLVVDRLLPLPFEEGAADDAGTDAARRNLSLRNKNYPVATAPVSSELAWPVSLDRAERLAFGYHVEKGPGRAQIEILVKLVHGDADETELFRDRIVTGTPREQLQKVDVALPESSGRGTIVFTSRLVGAETADEQLRVNWVNPRLLAKPETATKRPNVIVICIDTVRADRFRAFGGAESALPLLDQRLERHGVSFTAAYANAGWSLPSMATLLTGRLPGRHHAGRRTDLGPGSEQFNLTPKSSQGGIELVIAGRRYRFQMLHRSIPTLQEILAANGYTTGTIYNNGYINYPTRVLKGMDETHNYRITDAAMATDLSLDWIEDNADRAHFLFVHYMDPHAWARRAEEMNPGWKAQPYQPELRERYLAAYDDLLGYTDVQVHRLLSALENKGYLDDSYVVLVSDHGEAFFEEGDYVGHGDVTKDVVLRVPLAIWGPGIPHASVSSRVSVMDVVPTLLDVLEIPSDPYDLNGHSLLPATAEEAEAADRPVISEFVLGASDAIVMYRGPWKLVLYPTENTVRLHDRRDRVSREIDLARQRPRAGDEMLDLVRRYRRKSLDHFRSLRYSTTRVDRETLDSLRALGYIQ